MALEDESREIEMVVSRLADRFPDAAASQIRAAVQAELAHFDDAHVRDFVPVLIENTVSDTLREHYGAPVPTVPDDLSQPPADSGPTGSA